MAIEGPMLGDNVVGEGPLICMEHGRHGHFGPHVYFHFYPHAGIEIALTRRGGQGEQQYQGIPRSVTYAV